MARTGKPVACALSQPVYTGPEPSDLLGLSSEKPT
ncbi:hypothetical protein CJA_3542 [Cellvibrio japonicus Ueda107]|uniref:Uncharacterized protein n=1 Tax=Cellvibrio japonicus (strain Ueda107) TaxID=498211 RepID=B3PGU7_CELJU|nr:hypothetical protein CJA_3542 [Cellvibrio japonicus Ueda107]